MRRRLDLASVAARAALSRCCSSSSTSSRAASGALAGTSKASSSSGAFLSASESSSSSSSSSIKSRLLFGFSGSRRAFSSAAEAGASAGGGSSSPSPRGPVSYASLALTMATGAGIVFYYDHLKQQKVRAALEGAKVKGKGGTAATAGAAAIGGPFSLVDSSGRAFTEQNLVGNGWHLLYFGFTRCPDICPDELEKIAAVTDALEEKLREEKEKKDKESGSAAGGGVGGEKNNGSKKTSQNSRVVTPVFISVDPERDPPAHVGAYVREFHPRMLGLTGTAAQCRAAARAYRVYYARAAASPGEEEKEGKSGAKKVDKKEAKKVDEDYLIDHSIITYLIDPKGKFVTFYGKNVGAEEMVESVLARVAEWEEEEEEQGGGGKE